MHSDYSTVKFLRDSVSGQTATHPMDVLKIRMQVSRSGLMDTMKKTMKEQGLGGFYTGLSGSLLRQVTYTTTRIGTFNTLSELCE